MYRIVLCMGKATMQILVSSRRAETSIPHFHKTYISAIAMACVVSFDNEIGRPKWNRFINDKHFGYSMSSE